MKSERDHAGDRAYPTVIPAAILAGRGVSFVF